MRLLLDTHVAVWATNIPERIPENIRDMIADKANHVAVSTAAVWEIAIKRPLRRADPTPVSASQAISDFAAASFTLLDVTASHAAFVERLPLLHGDPFDRLMLSQAMIEGMQFVTYDRHLAQYGVPMLTWP